MQHLTVVLILGLAIAASAMSIKPRPVIDLKPIESAEDLTMTIRKLPPHEFSRGKFNNLYEEYMKQVEAASQSQSAHESRATKDLDWAAVVNIGKQVWDVIVKNQPTIAIKSANASAVPEGITRWTQLTNWRNPYSESYEVSYTNLYKVEVIKYVYTVVFIPGGKYLNKGQYLTGVSVIPSDLHVAWGYDFTCSIEVPNVLNAGSEDEPIGAAEIHMTYTVETVVSKNRQTKAWWVKGNGEINEL